MVLKHALAILIVPVLLAPVRFQTSEGEVVLEPALTPAASATALPAASALSPTVLRVSPTIALPSPVAKASATVVALPAPAADTRMPEVTALVCGQALQTLGEMAVLNYQKKRSQAAMTITLAASTGAGEASQRVYPSILHVVAQAMGELPFFSSGRSEMATVHATAQKACANPHAKVAPGSRIEVARPD